MYDSWRDILTVVKDVTSIIAGFGVRALQLLVIYFSAGMQKLLMNALGAKKQFLSLAILPEVLILDGLPLVN